MTSEKLIVNWPCLMTGDESEGRRGGSKDSLSIPARCERLGGGMSMPGIGGADEVSVFDLPGRGDARRSLRAGLRHNHRRGPGLPRGVTPERALHRVVAVTARGGNDDV